MRKKALVVVLGEIARSPRMQYHCMSLANNNYDVSVIANYGGRTKSDKSCDELEKSANIKQYLMRDTMSDWFKRHMPSILAYIFKTLWQTYLLIRHLLLVQVPHIIVMQNPPSIPTLPVICLYSRVFGSKLVIDWHNYGYSILSLNLKPTHPLVRASKFVEIRCGQYADAGLCVSNTMRKNLMLNFKITYPIHVLYDKPPNRFKPLNLREKHSFFLKVKHEIPQFKSPADDFIERSPRVGSDTQAERLGTRFTMTCSSDKNVIIPRPNRPAIVLSSTSWTEDEDFGLLLEALKRYDNAKTNQILSGTVEDDHCDDANLAQPCMPSLVCVITGKGPLKDYYASKIKQMNMEHVEIILPWLTANDYPKMVGCADLGICLHSSSSGHDLPMKVVDMFGCGVPVLAYNYETISELVVENHYGLTFSTSNELFLKLVHVLQDFYEEDNRSRDHVAQCSSLGRYKKNIKRHFLLNSWETNWNKIARPVFDKLCLDGRSN